MKNNSAISSICGAGAQLAWIYAWAAFLMISFFQRLYPLPEAVGSFALAAFLTQIQCRFRWRGFQIAGLHLIGMGGAAIWVVYIFYYPTEPLWSSYWFEDFINRQRAQSEWFLLLFVVGYTVVFWSAGIRFASQKKGYFSACSRFDRGVCAFFCLFLVKLVLHAKMGVQFRDSMTVWLIFPFFIFSLTEVGLARDRVDVQQGEYLAASYVVGVFASFTVGALVIGAAVFSFFLPYLTMASAVGYDLVKGAAGSLEPFIIAIIRFIFGYVNLNQKYPAASPGIGPEDALLADEPGVLMLLLQTVLFWGGWTLLIATGLLIAAAGLWFLLRWLFKKPGDPEHPGHQWGLGSWWIRLQAMLRNFLQWTIFTGRRNSALQFYAALQRWRKINGYKQRSDETPLEYGNRLAQQFPQLSAEIMLIIEMLHREVYGEIVLYSQQIKRVRQAWEKLRSPLLWPYRIKSIMTNS